MMMFVMERGKNTFGIGAKRISQPGVGLFANLSCAR
jgi:hypothetical protein